MTYPSKSWPHVSHWDATQSQSQHSSQVKVNIRIYHYKIHGGRHDPALSVINTFTNHDAKVYGGSHKPSPGS